MTLKEIKANIEPLVTESNDMNMLMIRATIPLALIAIIDELDEIVDHHLYRGEYDEIIARGLGPLT